MGQIPASGISAFMFSESSIHSLVEALQGVVTTGDEEYPLSTIYSHNYRKGSIPFADAYTFFLWCGGDGDLAPIWEYLARIKGQKERLNTLNPELLRGITFFWQVLGGRSHSSDYVPLLDFSKTYCF